MLKLASGNRVSTFDSLIQVILNSSGHHWMAACCKSGVIHGSYIAELFPFETRYTDAF